MSNFSASILNLLGFSSPGRNSRRETDEAEPADLTNMVKKLVLDNHRTMFYTVTLSPTTQHRVVESLKSKTPSLKVRMSAGFSYDIYHNII